MPGKQAKILSLGDVNDLLVFASCTRHPLRNRVIVLLAAKAGLRAVEIAQLTWDMVLDPTGDIGTVIELRDVAAKNGSGRLIPAHPDLRQALAAYRRLSTGIGPLIRSERGGPMTPLAMGAIADTADEHSKRRFWTHNVTRLRYFDALQHRQRAAIPTYKQFKSREGHCRVPRGHEEGSFKLGTWVVNQRNRRNNLSVERKQRLKAIGFVWRLK